MSETKKKGLQLYQKIITDNCEISPGVYLLAFKRDFEFLPGQVVRIGIDPYQPPRIYSICSGNNEDEVRILFNIKEDGFLTPKMAAMIPGDTIWVSEPYGSFLGIKEPAWLIATGTGIAPFYSTIKCGMDENKTLIHGVSFLNQFYFEDELESTLGTGYIRCCSRENSCNTFPGRVTEYLSETDIKTDLKYLLCGKALMVVEVRDLLIKKGVPFGNILAEIYF